MGVLIGIDAGSVAIKAIMLDEDSRPLAWLKECTGHDVAGQCGQLVEKLTNMVDSGGSIDAICGTGYGRNLVSGTDFIVSEILANALGAGWMWKHWQSLGNPKSGFGEAPEPGHIEDPFRTIVDIGGQDSKVITFTADGMVDQFAMNERCAAGTGRFLEVMARILEVDLTALDRLGLSSEDSVTLSSTCTVFAESEVVSLIAEGVDRRRVAAGLFDAVASRAVELARRIGWEGPVFFDGGTSHFRALRKALARRMDCEVAVPPCAEFTTALGAALYATENL
jgi:predicted CoA-substrate-specific enzyme activase